MKISRPILFLLLGTLVLAYILVSGDSAPSSASRVKPKAKKKASAQGVTWSEEDYEVNKDGQRFKLVNEPLRNAFKPLVTRRQNNLSTGPGGILLGIAGTPGWVYTGMAEVDGIPQALLENSITQDGVFLKQGEKWNGAVVHQIKPDELVFMDKTGVLQRVALDVNETTPGVSSPGGFQPVNPPLRGVIGQGGIAVRPESPATRPGSGRDLARNPSGTERGTGVGDEN
ncbi:MAG: hypothetical protein WAO58_05310 [Fimbriimonadaceae bacterium]